MLRLYFYINTQCLFYNRYSSKYLLGQLMNMYLFNKYLLNTKIYHPKTSSRYSVIITLSLINKDFTTILYVEQPPASHDINYGSLGEGVQFLIV